MSKHTINWFEIPVNDFERARKFYSHILDFEMVDMLMDNDRLGFFQVRRGV